LPIALYQSPKCKFSYDQVLLCQSLLTCLCYFDAMSLVSSNGHEKCFYCLKGKYYIYINYKVTIIHIKLKTSYISHYVNHSITLWWQKSKDWHPLLLAYSNSEITMVKINTSINLCIKHTKLLNINITFITW